MSETRSLHRKLAEVYAIVERIPKNGTAPAEMGGYPFVQVGDAADPIRKALSERHLTMLPSAVEIVGQSEHETENRSGKTVITTTCDVRTTWTVTDGESGETATIQSMGSGQDRGDKYVPKALTNSMKYAILLGFLMPTGDEPEAAVTDDRQRRTRTSQAGPRPVPSSPAGDARHDEGSWDGKVTTTATADGTVRKDRTRGDFAAFKILLDEPIGTFRSAQVRFWGDLGHALALSIQANGMPETATVWGSTEVASFKDRETKRDTSYLVINATRVMTPEWTLPASDTAAPPSEPVAGADSDLDNLPW